MTDRHAAFIGSIPDAYDRFLGPMLFDPYADDLVRRLTFKRTVRVLELACGTGRLTGRIAAALPNEGQLVATDLNEPMLDYARSKLPSAKITWRTADMQELPFPSESFDYVVCQFGVMFVPDKMRCFTEARRVLKPGGLFVFTVWGTLAENSFAQIGHETIGSFFAENPPQFYYVPFGFNDRKEIETMLKQAGFDKSNSEYISQDVVSPSARDAALGLVVGNPVMLDIRERARASTDDIVDAVAERLAAIGGQAPLRLPTRALVVNARRG